MECESQEELEKFVSKDPFVKNDLVVSHSIEELEILGSKGIKELKGILNYRPI